MRVPPIGDLEITDEVIEVAHGFDVLVTCRALKDFESLRDDAMVIVFMHLVNSLEADGHDANELVRMVRDMGDDIRTEDM